MVTWAAKARFRVLPCRVICPGGAEVVRRMAPHELQTIHDQAQNQAEGCDPLNPRWALYLQEGQGVASFRLKGRRNDHRGLALNWPGLVGAPNKNRRDQSCHATGLPRHQPRPLPRRTAFEGGGHFLFRTAGETPIFVSDDLDRPAHGYLFLARAMPSMISRWASSAPLQRSTFTHLPFSRSL